MKEPLSTETVFRLGSAAIGLLVGLVLGFLLAVGTFVVTRTSSFPPFVFGGAALGVAIGVALPAAARALAEGAVHFLIGVANAFARGEIEPNNDAPDWLKVLFWLGVAAGVVAIVVLRW